MVNQPALRQWWKDQRLHPGIFLTVALHEESWYRTVLEHGDKRMHDRSEMISTGSVRKAEQLKCCPQVKCEDPLKSSSRLRRMILHEASAMTRWWAVTKSKLSITRNVE